MAGQLALQLDLPCAKPLQVRLNPQIIASEPDPIFRGKLLTGPEILVASLSAGTGWSVWSDAMSIPRDKLQRASEIYLFDTIIQNWDRCAPNPNLLAQGDEVLMIDHGEAFVSATGTDAERAFHQEPWRLGAIMNSEGEYEVHPLWPKLRPKTHVDFKLAAERWRALPEDAFALIAASVPDSWSRTTASRIVAYLTKAVENMDAIVANVEQNFLK